MNVYLLKHRLPYSIIPFCGSQFSASTKGCEIFKRILERSLGTLIGEARTEKLLNHLYYSPDSSSSILPLTLRAEVVWDPPCPVVFSLF